MWKIIVGLLAAFWFAFFVAFEGERLACTPLFSPPCEQWMWQKFGDFVLFHWMTDVLAAGFMAIAAAFVGGSYINKQIAQANQQELDRIARRHAAARAMMPLALSAVTEYASAIMQMLRTVADQAGAGLIPRSFVIPQLPLLPVQAIGQFKEIIETSPLLSQSEPFRNILSKIQILNSRLTALHSSHGRRGHITLAIEVDEYIINAAVIAAWSAALFRYARYETDDVPISVAWEEVRAVLRIENIDETAHADLFKIILHREANDRVPA